MQKIGVWRWEINPGSNRAALLMDRWSSAYSTLCFLEIESPRQISDMGQDWIMLFHMFFFWITVYSLKNLRSLGNGILFHGFLSYHLFPKLKKLQSDQVLELEHLQRGFVACVSNHELIIQFRETLSLLQNIWAPSRVCSTEGLITWRSKGMVKWQLSPIFFSLFSDPASLQHRWEHELWR